MTTAACQPLPRWTVYVTLGVLLLASLALHFHKLGHAGIKDLDEAYHAIVARSMLDDPLKPTLYATPYLPYDFHNWQGNHVWLHKPPVALWQIAGSFAVFGESNFTLRLPSALLATAAVALTFLIGRSLFTAEAGLFAAFLLALSPAITRLVHGQVFSDHVDIAMLFWCELAVFLLIRAARSGRASDAVLVGVAQAIAWMTKSYPALFVSGLAFVLYLLPRFGFGRDLRFAIRQLLSLLVAALLVAAPWIVFCLLRYPREFLYEQGHVFQHLYRDVEDFRAPWDRLLADYLLRGFAEWYVLVIVALFAVTVDAIRSRDARRFVVAAWAWGVLIPHLLATSKTPTATLIGWPAGWLAVGVLMSDALRRRPFAIGAVVAAALLLIFVPQFPRESVMGYGSNYHFGSIAVSQWRVAAIAAAIAVAGLVTSWVSRPQALVPPVPHSGRGLTSSTIGLALTLLFVFPIYQHTRLAVLTSNDVPSDPIAFRELGIFVRAKSPPNAVFLVDAQTRGEHIIAMWWLDRACYPLNQATLDDDVAMIVHNGGEPFILSRRPRLERELPNVAGEAKLFVPQTLRGTTLPSDR